MDIIKFKRYDKVEGKKEDKKGEPSDDKSKGNKWSADKTRKFLDKVMKRLKRGVEAYDHNVNSALEDLNFLNGDQWEEDEKKRRKNRKRPMITINMLPDKVDRVVGDIRQNRAKIRVKPADSNANHDIAKIREGIIRGIEYRSNASAIYDYAGGRVAECGFGTWRYMTRYCEDNPFVQEIVMSLIKNSFSVIIDPEAKEPNKRDAKWAFILDKMGRDAFEDKYPDATVPDSSMEFGEGMGEANWFFSNTVTVAEYFEVELKTVTKCLMEDGTVVDKKDAEQQIKEWEQKYEVPTEPTGNYLSGPPVSRVGLLPSSTPIAAQGGLPPTDAAPPAPMGEAPAGINPLMGPPAPKPMMGGPAPMVPPIAPPTMGTPNPMGGSIGAQGPMGTINPLGTMPTPPPLPKPKIMKERDTKVRVIQHYIVTACDILEGPSRIPGKYIPIVEVTGKERDIEGKTYIRGLIRDAKDPQKLVNYWNTAAAETVALAPKAPWIGTAKQFEGYEIDYANANIDNMPFLKYNADPKAGGPPSRVHAGEPPVAIFTQISISERNLNTVAGVGPDMRDIAPDASSTAIIQRTKPTELATFPFIDNLAQAQLYGGMILNEMIPEVYDTERDVPILREDESETFVPINMKASDAVKLLRTNPERYKGLNAAKLRHAILSHGTDARFNDIGVGLYSLAVDLGPSYATQRQESSANFVKLAQTNPRLWDVAGDLIVKNLDVDGADKLANRLKKTIPPRLLEQSNDGEPMPPPPPVPPQVQLLQERAKTEKIRQEKEILKTRVEMIRLYKETKETEKELRQEILKVLQQLHAPEHFADNVVNMPQPMGQQIP